MNSWFTRLLQNSRLLAARRAVEQAVYLIAERSLPKVRKQLLVDASNMTAAERFGYVQARAHGVVTAQARQLAKEHGLETNGYDELVLPALQRTANLIVRQPPAQPVRQLPIAHVRLRIAG
jgi:hypothetical protein